MNSCELHEIPPENGRGCHTELPIIASTIARAWEGFDPLDGRNRVDGAKGRRAVRELGDRNGSFVGVRRHRREQGIVDLPGGRRAAGTDRPAAARWARVTFPGPGFPRRTGPARVHLALRAAVLPPAAAPPARERRDPSCAARRDAQRQWWRLRSAHWSRRARQRKAESRRRAFPLRLQSAEWRPARVGSHAALGPSKVSGDVGPCVAGERGPGLATLTCGKATPACACWYARAE